MIWRVAALVLGVGLLPCAALVLRGGLADRLVGLEMSAILVAQICVLWAVGIDRVPFVDVGLAVGVLELGGGLVFARFLERWL